MNNGVNGMEKFVFIMGSLLTALGIGFLSAHMIFPGLNGAFVSGGYLWAIIGAATMGLGLHYKKRQVVFVNQGSPLQ
jgi:hypothetical protein|tara:strand:- start:713 stop:943 length:231 start_codon:yes stop_codon:yes gene_type:complete